MPDNPRDPTPGFNKAAYDRYTEIARIVPTGSAVGHERSYSAAVQSVGIVAASGPRRPECPLKPFGPWFLKIMLQSSCSMLVFVAGINSPNFLLKLLTSGYPRLHTVFASPSSRTSR